MNDLSDVVAESAILAGLYKYGINAWVEVGEILNEKCWSETTNLALFQCMSALFKNGVSKLDMPSIRSTAASLGYDYLFTDKTELSYIKSVFNTYVEFENLRIFAGKLRKILVLDELKSLSRSIYDELDKKTGEESFNQIISSVETPLFDYCKTLNNSEDIPISLGGMSEKYIEQVETNPISIVGLSTGYPLLDCVIGGGLRASGCCLMGGRQKSGKSQLSLNIGLNVSSRNVHCLYLDNEMTYSSHIPRAISNILFTDGIKIKVDDIERGSYTKSPYLKQKVKESVEKFKTYPLKYLTIAGKRIEHVASIIKRWLMVDVKDSGMPLVIYDYIRLNDVSELKNNIQERQILQSMIVALNDLAMKYNIPILVLTQLNRDAITSESSAIISGSDAILNTVSSFSIIKVKSAEEIAADLFANGNRKIVNICTRFGAGNDLNDYICYQLHGAYGKLIELDMRSNIRARLEQEQKIEEKKEKEENLSLGEL